MANVEPSQTRHVSGFAISAATTMRAAMGTWTVVLLVSTIGFEPGQVRVGSFDTRL